jgi:hypothetical protein
MRRGERVPVVDINNSIAIRLCTHYHILLRNEFVCVKHLFVSIAREFDSFLFVLLVRTVRVRLVLLELDPWLREDYEDSCKREW